MSSWDSYLPKGKKYKKIIGHGLNKQELERNKIFDSYWIQNFNLSQQLPLDKDCLLYTSPSPRDMRRSRMPSSA